MAVKTLADTSGSLLFHLLQRFNTASLFNYTSTTSLSTAVWSDCLWAPLLLRLWFDAVIVYFHFLVCVCCPEGGGGSVCVCYTEIKSIWEREEFVFISTVASAKLWAFVLIYRTQTQLCRHTQTFVFFSFWLDSCPKSVYLGHCGFSNLFFFHSCYCLPVTVTWE